jgi:hypothetical protein
MDSTIDTVKHIKYVQYLLHLVIEELLKRSRDHDASKLEEPEKPIFDEFSPKLKDSTYMSDEYKEFLKEMNVALKHHYENNRHHPEHYEDKGIEGMSLIDLIEMMCDWRAAAARHANGDMTEGMKKSIERFKIKPQLAKILGNTAFYFSCHG